MAYGNPGNPSEGDMYSDAHVGAPRGEEAPHDEMAEEKEGHTYPLPKEVLEGKHFEVGDEVVLRITEIRDDQIFVSYAPAKEQEKGKEGPAEREPGQGEEAMAGAGKSQMASMYEDKY